MSNFGQVVHTAQPTRNSPGHLRTRQFYLGVDFVREGTRVPKLQIWQEQLVDSYPHIRELALHSTGDVNLLPKGSTALRIRRILTAA